MFPSQYYVPPDAAALRKAYLGKAVAELPTPSVVIDRRKFQANSARMLQSAASLGVEFRCHVKTHKTLQGVEVQLGHGTGAPTTNKIIVSTLAEAWFLLPLVEKGLIADMLFGLPVARLRFSELQALSEKIPQLRLMVDSVAQANALAEYAKEHKVNWSVFIKVDMGYARAGVPYDSDLLQELVGVVVGEEHLSLYGFYCHAGNSYGASGAGDARKFFLEEVRHANAAVKVALARHPKLMLQISVGATPTAHVSQKVDSVALIEADLGEPLLGTLEVHAGNYPCCDLQQVATGLVLKDDVSLFLLAEVLTEYPGRHGKVPGEQLINAGAIALSRETGPLPGHGVVVRPAEYGDWFVGKVSQEHGILYPNSADCKFIPYGTKVLVVPQHACITACAHAWYFVVEDDTVVDIWVAAKLW